MSRMLYRESGQQAEENYRNSLMEWGRVTETERMPSLGVGYTELGCSKLKKAKQYSGPNFRARTEQYFLANRLIQLFR
jgi:hypothetical protein